MYLTNRFSQEEYDVMGPHGAFTHRSKFKWVGEGKPELKDDDRLPNERWSEEVVETYANEQSSDPVAKAQSQTKGLSDLHYHNLSCLWADEDGIMRCKREM